MKRLTKIANKCKTDKGSTFEFCHEYTEIYEDYFKKYENPNILEIGTGEGNSAKMFNIFYDGDCSIVTLDINKKFENFFSEENIHYHYIDTSNEESIKEVYEELKNIKFDIIIDDGSHISADQCKCLKYFYKLLKKDGIYIIEDLITNVLWENNFNDTLLYFLITCRNISEFSEATYQEILSKYKNMAIYSRKNDVFAYGWCTGRSVTAILTFDNES